MSHLAREAVEQIDLKTMVEFAALRQEQGHSVRELILPPGMSGLPRWIAELTGLRALHASGLTSGDGVRDALHLPGLQLLDLTGGQFPGSEWAGHIGEVRLVLRYANLEGASFGAIDLVGADLHGAKLNSASFRAVNLRAADLGDSDVAGSRWTSSNLDKTFAETMRNAESATFEDCTALNARLPLVLASKIRPDDVLRPGDSFWIAANSPFLSAVDEMCCELQLRVRQADTVDSYDWVRDPFFRTARLPQESFRLPAAHEKAAPSGTALAHNHWSSHLREPLSETPEVHPDRTDDPFEPRFGSGSNVIFIPTTGGRFLEGGNVFITGERRCVIGHDELRHGIDRSDTPLAGLSSEQVDRIAGRYNGVSREQAVSLWRARREEKREVKALLGAQALVIIPQYLFHIDLQMAYLGNEQFLIHSFAATLEFLQDQEPQLRRELGDESYEAVLQANQRHVKRGGEERYIEKTCRRLKQAGLQAVKCCLMLSTDYAKGRWETDGLHSQFANGVAFESGSGERIFITLGAPRMPTHKAYFREKCGDLGVSVRFMCDEIWLRPPGGRTNKLPFDPASFMSRNGGGLRCLSQRNLEAPLNHRPDASV